MADESVREATAGAGSDLAKVDLPVILEAAASRRQTGILTVQGEDDIVALSFQKGLVAAADALNESIEVGLVRRLQAEGRLQEQDLSFLEVEQGGARGRVFELLVQRELLTRDEIQRSLESHLAALLLRACSWRRGDLKFYALDEVAADDWMQPLAVEPLLGAAAALAREGTLEGTVALTAGLVLAGVASAEVLEAGVSPDEARLLAALSPPKAMTAVPAESGLSEVRLLLAAVRLQRGDLIRAQATKPAESEIEQTSDLPPTVPSRVRLARSVGLWLPAIAAAALLFSLGSAALRQPDELLAPVPSGGGLSAELEAGRRSTLYAKIERAVAAYYRAWGHLPSGLRELVDRRQMTARFLTDPGGEPLELEVEGASFALKPQGGDLVAGRVRLGLATTGLLPELEQAHAFAGERESPLVLLD